MTNSTGRQRVSDVGASIESNIDAMRKSFETLESVGAWAVTALEQIRDCTKENCEEYVAEVDAIACSALAKIEGVLP